MFLIAKSLDPGYIEPQQDKNFFQLLIKFHPSKICYDCQVIIDIDLDSKAKEIKAL